MPAIVNLTLYQKPMPGELTGPRGNPIMIITGQNIKAPLHSHLQTHRLLQL